MQAQDLWQARLAKHHGPAARSPIGEAFAPTLSDLFFVDIRVGLLNSARVEADVDFWKVNGWRCMMRGA